jgi:class 3 adenylate cyclase
MAEFLGIPEGQATLLLEEGRLEGAILTTLRRRGVAATPNVKNSVQALVRTMEPARAASLSRPTSGSPLQSDTTITIMFTDVVGSSPIMERLGDREGRRVLRTHERIIRQQTAAQDGIEVKSMGDGFMLTFPSARRGVACAIEVQRALAQMNNGRTQMPISVRIGLSVGEPIHDDKDMFGTSVIMAARVMAMAKGGQILASQIAHDLASTSGDFEFRPLGPMELKGLPGSHPLFEVVW